MSRKAVLNRIEIYVARRSPDGVLRAFGDSDRAMYPDLWAIAQERADELRRAIALEAEMYTLVGAPEPECVCSMCGDISTKTDPCTECRGLIL